MLLVLALGTLVVVVTTALERTHRGVRSFSKADRFMAGDGACLIVTTSGTVEFTRSRSWLASSVTAEVVNPSFRVASFTHDCHTPRPFQELTYTVGVGSPGCGSSPALCGKGGVQGHHGAFGMLRRESTVSRVGSRSAFGATRYLGSTARACASTFIDVQVTYGPIETDPHGTVFGNAIAGRGRSPVICV